MWLEGSCFPREQQWLNATLRHTSMFNSMFELHLKSELVELQFIVWHVDYDTTVQYRLHVTLVLTLKREK